MKNKKLISIILTFVIISFLIFSGPANAITLGITDVSTTTPNEGSDITFLAKVDLHTSDIVPLTNLTVNVKDGSDNTNASCVFSLSGTELYDLTNTFTIQKLHSNVNHTNFLSGYGYGYASSGYTNQTFGYGYQYFAGYGYDTFSNSIKSGSGATTAEFIYNITWRAPDVGTNTAFTIELQANTQDNASHSAVFQTKTATSITVQYDSTPDLALNETTEVTQENTYISVPANNTNSDITVQYGIENATLNLSSLISDAATVVLNGSLDIEANTSEGIVSIQMPEDLNISGNTSWTGDIHLPMVKATSSVTPGGTVSKVIEIGFDDVALTFDKGVRILIEGEAGKSVGYSRAGTFTKITSTCSADTQAVGNALTALTGDCKIDSGDDLVIWTKHFTKFATYTPTAAATVAASTSTTSGGATSEIEKRISYMVGDLEAGVKKTIKLVSDIIGITEIDLKVTENLYGVKIVVEKFIDVPSDLSKESLGKVYKYWQFKNENLPDDKIEEAAIRFKVDRSWLTDNGLKTGDIVLVRYDGKEWVDLETTATKSEESLIYYEAAANDGFSYFAIRGKVAAAEEEEETKEEPAEEEAIEKEIIPTEEEGKVGVTIAWIVAIAIVIGLAVFLIMRRRKRNDQMRVKIKPKE